MFAKNKEVQKLYQSKWNELAKIREYTAVVEGITDNKGHIESYLKQTKTLLVYSSKSKDGYFAVTDYESIQCLRFIFLLAEEIKLDAICMILSILY